MIQHRSNPQFGQTLATPRLSRRWSLKAAATTTLATDLARPLSALAKQIGVQACHVEQDQSPPPLKGIVQSLRYLNESKS